MELDLAIPDLVKGWRMWSDLHYPGDFESSIVREHRTDLPNSTLLEIGCGDGRVIKRLAPLCKSAVGIDLNQEMIAHMQLEQSKAIEQITLSSDCGQPPIVSFENMSATDLKFSDDSFDIAIMPWCLHQIDDRQKALSEAKRVLKPSGHLFVFGLLPGGDYEEIVKLLGLDPGPQVDPVSAYEKPLAETFGKFQVAENIGPEDKRQHFGFTFRSLEEALRCWDWALRNWHSHNPSQADLSFISTQLRDRVGENRISMDIRGTLYVCEKTGEEQ
ncbi:MAG: class I SAM-dependent methyltransferase [Candidatus Obscuribacterales bacterium]|nr:class I SAM-dependent methyltransferase [Candidatus Obscuribacterales bacterium]